MNHDWQATLAQGFGALLQRDVATVPTEAVYATYAWSEQLDAEWFIGVDASQLAAPECWTASSQAASLIDGACESDPWWMRMGVDLGRSLVLFDVETLADHPGMNTAINALAVDGASPSGDRAVWGEALAAVVDQWGWAVKPCGILARLHTDGSLLDALAAATDIAGKDDLDGFPDFSELLDYSSPEEVAEGFVDPLWEARLSAVVDPTLRDHLRGLCLRGYWAASGGAEFLGAECRDQLWPITHRGEVVAGWSFGLDAGTVVLELTKSLDSEGVA